MCKVEPDNEDGAQHPQDENNSAEYDSHSSSIHAAIIAACIDTGNSNPKPIRAKQKNLTLGFRADGGLTGDYSYDTRTI